MHVMMKYLSRNVKIRCTDDTFSNAAIFYFDGPACHRYRRMLQERNPCFSTCKDEGVPLLMRHDGESGSKNYYFTVKKEGDVTFSAIPYHDEPLISYRIIFDGPRS